MILPNTCSFLQQITNEKQQKNFDGQQKKQEQRFIMSLVKRYKETHPVYNQFTTIKINCLHFFQS